MDGDRVGALGASYGGYMVNWIAGAWPDRFKALVSHDGNLDERFAYYATEELWFPEWEHGGTPWENPAGYAKHNPVDLVKNWKTPMLVVHGALDYRVVDTGGIATFTAAQRQGHPVEAALLPGREPLGPEAAELDPLARHGARLAGSVGEGGIRSSSAVDAGRGRSDGWARLRPGKSGSHPFPGTGVDGHASGWKWEPVPIFPPQPGARGLRQAKSSLRPRPSRIVFVRPLLTVLEGER